MTKSKTTVPIRSRESSSFGDGVHAAQGVKEAERQNESTRLLDANLNVFFNQLEKLCCVACQNAAGFEKSMRNGASRGISTSEWVIGLSVK